MKLLILFVAVLFLILGAAILFTNGVEWLGKRLKLSEGGVGSVLAAVGTALPETIVPIVAIIWMGEEDVGIGAILGAPFMLVTLTLPLAGLWIIFLSSIKRRQGDLILNRDIPMTDLGYFLPSFSLAILASVIPFMIVKYIIAISLIIFYGRYMVAILKTGEVSEAAIAPLYFARSSDRPSMPVIMSQIVLALFVMVAGAHLIVNIIITLAPIIGVSALVLSLLLIPVATELPEKFNSLVWVAQRKDTLAVGNITGAMVFQGTIPVSIGLIFTSWNLEAPVLVSASLAVAGAGAYYWILRRGGMWRPWQLAAGALLYLAFGIYVWFL